PGLVMLTATATDADGDTASTGVDVGAQVSFADDGPTAGFTLGTTTVSIDESVGIQHDDQSAAVPSLFSGLPGTPIQWAQSSAAVFTNTSSFGADGAGSVTYALTTSAGGVINNVDSGFKATASGNEIFLFTEGNLVVGRELNSSGTVAFALALDGGKLDVAQYEALVQDTANNTNDDHKDLSGVIHVTQTVTDGDGDTATLTASGSLTVSFFDDGPSASNVTAATVLDDEAQTLFPANPGGTGDAIPPNVNVASGVAGSLFSAGADGLKSITFTNPA